MTTSRRSSASHASPRSRGVTSTASGRARISVGSCAEASTGYPPSTCATLLQWVACAVATSRRTPAGSGSVIPGACSRTSTAARAGAARFRGAVPELRASRLAAGGAQVRLAVRAQGHAALGSSHRRAGAGREDAQGLGRSDAGTRASGQWPSTHALIVSR